ncbi:gp53-like domain-containing protein [Morganella morganii]|uniref:gp53-like domain-containing protein n=1 Tax=Morganella morganii TaxID=582 RepID=UPI0020230104|nr:hypothetical protein [Morganella morganii]
MIYTDGTIAIKAGSPIVTGTGTQWKKNIHGVAPGQLISIENGTTPVSMMIRAVNSDTELVLAFNAPVTLSGAKYSIATTVPETISDAARTMSANQGYIVYFLQAMQQWMTDTGQVEIELPNGQKVTLDSIKALNDAISKIPKVVQGTGTSKTDVMSQDAVTKLADKKFDKTGGKITAGGRAIEIEVAANNAAYIQITDTLGNILHQMGKRDASNDLFLSNVSERGNLVVKGDGVRFNGNLLGFNCEALTSSAGYITIPTFTNGVKRNLILQWRFVSVPDSTSGTMASVGAAWPIPFPSTCISIMCSYSGGVAYSPSGTPFCSAQIVDRATFKAGSCYSKSAATLAVWGIGY